MGMAEERGLNPEHQGGQGPYCFIALSLYQGKLWLLEDSAYFSVE